jgi:hypothetical protein
MGGIPPPAQAPVGASPSRGLPQEGESFFMFAYGQLLCEGLSAEAPSILQLKLNLT